MGTGFIVNHKTMFLFGYLRRYIMEKYRVTIAESMTYKQFVGEIEASNREEAKKIAREIFIKENPIYSAHCKIIMCSRIGTY